MTPVGMEPAQTPFGGNPQAKSMGTRRLWAVCIYKRDHAIICGLLGLQACRLLDCCLARSCEQSAVENVASPAVVAGHWRADGTCVAIRAAAGYRQSQCPRFHAQSLNPTLSHEVHPKP